MKDMQVIEFVKHVEIRKRQEFPVKTYVKEKLWPNHHGFFRADTWEKLLFSWF